MKLMPSQLCCCALAITWELVNTPSKPLSQSIRSHSSLTLNIFSKLRLKVNSTDFWISQEGSKGVLEKLQEGTFEGISIGGSKGTFRAKCSGTSWKLQERLQGVQGGVQGGGVGAMPCTYRS